MRKKANNIFHSFTRNILGISIKRLIKDPSAHDKPKLKMYTNHDPAYSYMQDQVYRDQLIYELSLTADLIRAKNYFPTNPDLNTTTIIKDFFKIYSSRTQTDNTFGSGFHTAFWIYYIARLLDPELIVESGVWKGHTSWLLSQACPNARQYGFDKSLNHLEYNNLNVTMVEHDWQTYQFPDFDQNRALVFFDCHVNHAQRIIESKNKGFKHLLFDDNPPIHKLFSYIPGIPTAAMLYTGEGIEAPEIRWVWNGKEVIYPIDRDQAKQARELIKIHDLLPDVGGPTGYGGFTFLTYVQI